MRKNKKWGIQLTDGLYAGCDFMRLAAPIVTEGHIPGPDMPGVKYVGDRIPWPAAKWYSRHLAEECVKWLGVEGQKLGAKVVEL